MTHHVELRQFPHNMCRFNLSEEDLRAIVEPWALGEWVEFGERKWSPHQAKLTVLEGPPLSTGQLTMGRGWRTAQRQSEDVTERVLEAARARGSGPAATQGQAGASDGSPGGDEALAGALGSLLGEDPIALLAAWRLLAAADPGRRPSECLAAAERAVDTAGSSES
jgi:hypothetical protein